MFLWAFWLLSSEMCGELKLTFNFCYPSWQVNTIILLVYDMSPKDDQKE